MGSASRPKPRRLAEKLRQIRERLGLSQNGMLDRLELSEKKSRNSISNYEIGTREPPLEILLNYARAANVYVDALIDDKLDLPAKLPSSVKHEGIKRQSQQSGQRRTS